jgi:hypothetical protein
MIAYKFLRAGRVGPFSGWEWPEPGVWVSAGNELVACRRGVHACRIKDLPWWLGEELWEIELRGEVKAEEHKLVASAGCLRARIDAWTPALARVFGEACAWRARDRAVQALTRARYRRAAEQLASYGSLDHLLAAARGLADELPDTRVTLTIAADGASRALTGAAPTSAYIAAHAAGRLDGREGYDAERAWQSGWLVERLGL